MKNNYDFQAIFSLECMFNLHVISCDFKFDDTLYCMCTSLIIYTNISPVTIRFCVLFKCNKPKRGPFGRSKVRRDTFLAWLESDRTL